MRPLPVTVAIVFFLLFPLSLHAQSSPHVFAHHLKTIWDVDERIGEKEAEMPMVASIWGKKLEDSGLERVRAIAPVPCPRNELLEGRLCDDVSIAKADLLVAGKSVAQLRNTGPSGPGIGAKIEVLLQVFRIGEAKALFRIKQLSYDTGTDANQAYANALKKVVDPVAIRLTHLLANKLSPTAKGRIKVSGFSLREQQEDLLYPLHQTPYVSSVAIDESLHDSCTYLIDYSSTTWGVLARLIGRAQGNGIKIESFDLGEASGHYSPAKAFRLIVAVTELKDRSGDPGVSMYSEKLLSSIEREVETADYMLLARLPFRLAANPGSALRELKAQYGGDIVVIASVSRKGGGLFLTFEVNSLYGGKLFAESLAFEAENIEATCRTLFSRISGQLPDSLAKARAKMPASKRSRFDAWRKATGY